MANFYSNYFVLKLVIIIFLAQPVLASAYNSGIPTNPDSLSNLGHCKTVIVADTNCTTGEISLSAFIDWTWTGVHQPVQATWNNGLNAHKITVVPPGTWSWDPGITTCEIWHQYNSITFSFPFFEGPVELTGPNILCPEDDMLEINSNLNNYAYFEELTWSPTNPAGDFEPFPVSQAGTYALSVTDAFGCQSSDQITVIEVPLFSPVISGPVRLCPEGDTATLSILNPGLYTAFEWESGETTSTITVMEPGTYQVTATESHGCTGVGFYSIQSAEVGLFNIAVSSPTLCPGLLDTLRVQGGFSSYVWSNNVSGITNIVNQAGTYTVTVTNVYGCTGTQSATVTPLFPPVIQVASTPLCMGDTAVLTTLGGIFPQYQWSSGQTTESITASTPGTYSVTVSGTGVCTTSTSTVLDFAPAPTTIIDPPSPLNCLVSQIVLQGDSSSTGPMFPFQWSTPNGHFLSGDSTLHPTVDQPGTYILSITNMLTGCRTNDTVQVILDNIPPPADAGNPDTLSCAVQDFAIGPVPTPVNPDFLPSWSTSDGNILSGSLSWMPIVDQPGTYTVTVTYALNGCTSIASVIIGEDIAPPTVQIAPADLITCVQGTVPLDGSGSSNGPNFSYQWTTGNGILTGATNSPIAGASSVGTYNLLITNLVNGCTASNSTQVFADVNIPIVNALPPNTLNCSTLSTVIDASASSSGPTFQYNWTTTNGNILSGGNTLTPNVDAPGTYLLNLFNTSNNCTATLAVVVDQDIIPPLANAGSDAVLNCSFPTTVLDGSASSTGPGFSFNWTTPDGNIVSGNSTLNPTVDMDGTYFLEVLNQLNGCSDTASVVIMNDANAPVAIIAAPTTLNCTIQQTQIDASASSQLGNLSYLWSGNILAGQGTLQPTVNQAGVYSLTITNPANGCTDVESVTLGQDTMPPAALAGWNSLINCFNPTISLGDPSNPSGAGYTLQWTTTGGNFLSPTTEPVAIVNAAGDYHLLITNTQNGCTATDNVTVAADFVQPSANAGPTNELNCSITILMLQGSGSMGPNFSYLWTSGPGANIVSGANTLSPSINEPGIYNLLITNTQNGCTASSQVNVTENANGPIASAGLPQTLTCTLTNTFLSATGSSAGPLFSYNWSTANGNITAGANTATPAINAPGSYTITVTDSSNFCTETASVTILQNIQSPTVNAGQDDLLTCAVTNLLLQAQVLSSSSQNIDYQWSTPNGQIISGASTANPLINAPGDYGVTVTDNINGCTGTDQLTIAEDVVLPTAIIASPQTLTCAVQQVSLNAQGSSFGPNFDYYWTTPSGNFVSIQNPQQPIVDEQGIYNLLIVNTLNGCTQTSSVNVPEDMQLPNVEAGPVTGLDCDTQTNVLDGTASSQGPNFTYTWSTTNGQIISGGNTLNPTIGEPGNYVLTVLNTVNGCSSSDNVTVTEDVQPPLLTIAPPAVLTCVLTTTILQGSGTALGNTPSILWSSTNGNILTGATSFNPTVDAPGDYTLTVLNPVNGCTSTLAVTVDENIQIPTVQVLPAPLLTCSVLEISLQSTVPAQSGVVWTTSNGHIVSGANTANPIVDEPGQYFLSLTSTQNGCTNSAQIEVFQELDVPKGLHFNLLPPLCNGALGTITVDQISGGIGPFLYSLDGGQTFFPSAQFNQIPPGNYDLVIQDANGCELAKPIDVLSPPIPLVTAPPVFEIVLGESQEILAIVPPSFPFDLVDTVIWSPMEGLTFEGNSIQELLNPVAKPFVSTHYKVTIITKEGCRSEARTLLRVNRKVDIYAPNIIRPDDPDGDNSTFTLFARDESVALIRQLQIYDRWGSLIFENQDFRPNDPTAGWSGEYRGTPVNPGVFVWWAEVELVDGREVIVKGDVTIMR